MQSMLCGFDMNTLFKFLAFFGGFLIFWEFLLLQYNAAFTRIPY